MGAEHTMAGRGLLRPDKPSKGSAVKRIDRFAGSITETFDANGVVELWRDAVSNSPPFIDLFGVFRQQGSPQNLLIRNGLRPALPKFSAPRLDHDTISAEAAAESIFSSQLAERAGILLHVSNFSILGGLYIQFKRFFENGDPATEQEVDLRRDTIAVVVGGIASGVPIDEFSYSSEAVLLSEQPRKGFYTHAADVARRQTNVITGEVKPVVDFHYASAVSRLILENTTL